MEPAIGTVAVLPVLRRVRAGLLLDGGALGELLLPARELGDDAPPASLRVFVYEDGDGRPGPARGCRACCPARWAACGWPP